MENIYNWIMNFITNIDSFSVFFNCFLIVIESIIPPLPLSVFITILFVNYGPLLGFLISWISTVLGCLLSFYLFQTILKNFVDNKIRKYSFANKFLTIVDKIKFNNLVLIIAMPFTPAFVINIICAISKMDAKKFLPAIIIGKAFMVLFWGYVGTNVLESMKNPLIIIKVILLLIITYIFSKLVNKKFNLE